jgi:hypothetical protein
MDIILNQMTQKKLNSQIKNTKQLQKIDSLSFIF